MAGRYGRNQKRRHRAEIAALETALDFERFGPFERAQSYDTVIPVSLIAEEEETRRRDYRASENKLSITLRGVPSNLRDAHLNGQPVAVRGRRWLIEEVVMDREFDIFACGGYGRTILGNHITLKLVALGRRDLSHRELVSLDTERKFH